MNILKIKELAKIAHEKRDRFRSLGMVNANQPDPKKRETLTVAYEIARAEMFEANTALLKEQQT